MSSSSKQLTPMMRQYLEAKRKLPPNTLLLFRLGDFYEMFDEDAREGARLLGIALTQRNGQPMAGIPYHAADNYVQKVLAAGIKVAICEQTETPKPGQLVNRALTRILTPGTLLEDHQLEARRNQYLAALQPYGEDGLAAAWLDLGTGDFVLAAETKADDLLAVLQALNPAELLVMQSLHPGLPGAWHRLAEGKTVSSLPDWQMDQAEGLRKVLEILGLLNLQGFGIDHDHPGLGPAGALLFYAEETLRTQPANIQRLRLHENRAVLIIDPATQRNLELVRASHTQTREGSLLAAMDATVTAPGARLLEQFLTAATLHLPEIHRRQRCVGELLEAPGCANELQDYLKGVRDLPRILGRMRNRLRNPRELGAIRDTLCQLPLIVEVLDQFDGTHLSQLKSGIHVCPDLRNLLQGALQEELPSQLQEGGYIADGYDTDLDKLRSLTRDSRQWLSDFERAESERTGIKNLRVKYNGAFGYFIEVTKSNLHLVPENYTRKQTTVNAERFITPELREQEQALAHADERAIAREEILFRALIESVLTHADALEQTATVLAQLDVFIGWARIAREWDYCCPEVNDGEQLLIENGRHPVVEQMMRREKLKGAPGQHDFVPNGVHLDTQDTQVAIITGPNMAGKSTYIRQVALIALMAQVGSWVPATRCVVGWVDRIFSRVGASDELSRGNSTFMVEMNETANILNNATRRSLIILDEIGRGTSTYDGLSIAWAVVEHLHGEADGGPRTLFATHYHELTQLEQSLSRVRNFCVAVKEWNDRIIFVRQILPGAADRSYGIQVARLAGLPHSVIDRAKTILERLEADDSSHNILRQRLQRKKSAKDADADQLTLF